MDAVSRLHCTFLSLSLSLSLSLAERGITSLSVDGVKSRHGNFRLLQETNYETTAVPPKRIITPLPEIKKKKNYVMGAINFQNGKDGRIGYKQPDLDLHLHP